MIEFLRGSIKKIALSRREILRQSGAASLGVVAGAVVVAKSATAVDLIATPPQTEGPFYPVLDQLDKDADMTLVDGREESAEGERVLVEGCIKNGLTLEPVAGAIVEFWQACVSGRYDHPDDPNTAPLDPNFQYWAQVRTDNNGFFAIQTIIPGAYPVARDWIRPPHIHVKVHARGLPSLTTQVYFEGHPLNSKDLILQKLSIAQQQLVMIHVEKGRLTKRWDVWMAPKPIVPGHANRLINMTLTPEL